MSAHLVVNPLLEVHKNAENADCFDYIVPKPGEGLQVLKITEEDNDGLFELTPRFLQIGFRYLDAATDLTEEARTRLVSSAILIEEGSQVENPFFSCQLDDVAIKEDVDFSSCSVNPTTEFEPIDLTRFAYWFSGRHMSPLQPTVWVRQPGTGVKTGYWLTPDQAEIVSGVLSGDLPVGNVDPGVASKLWSADVLIDEDELKAREASRDELIEKAASHFAEKKYAVIESLMPPEQMAAMRKFYKEYVARGFMKYGDNQVKNRYWQHNEPLASFLHHELADVISRVAGKKLILAYCYAASYNEGADLKPHRDRDQCEYSISFQVDYEPAQKDDLSPWALGVSIPQVDLNGRYAFDWKEFESDPGLSGDTSYINLKSGDGLFYKGCELIHFRKALLEGATSTSLFLHYVPEGFDKNLD